MKPGFIPSRAANQCLGRILRFFGVLFLAVVFSSCNFNAEYVAKKVSTKSDSALLGSYLEARFMPNLSQATRNIYRETEGEILRRKLARESKIQAIRERKVQLGMTKNEVFMSWGKPSDINKTISQHYYLEQWVYGGYSYSGGGSFRPMSFVYFDADGRVTSIQN